MMAIDVPPQQPAVVLVHDARAVYDTGALRFEDFMVQGQPVWIVAIVTPGPGSGSATVPGAYINANTGEFVTPGNTQTVLLKVGKWRAVEGSDQRMKSGEGEYSWTENLGPEKRKLLPEDYYSPFAHGGMILCRLTPGATGIDQFGPVRLLLQGWQEYPGPAFEFAATHPSVMADNQVTPAEVTQLKQMLSEKNKFLAVLAFRALVAAGRMEPNLAGNQLTNAEANLAAVYTYLVLASTAGDPHHLSQKLIDLTRTTHDVTKLRSIALGAFATGLFHPENSGNTSSSKVVLRAVRQRLKELRIAIEKDTYMFSIFEKLGV
jgi:hypothetical protein